MQSISNIKSIKIILFLCKQMKNRLIKFNKRIQKYKLINYMRKYISKKIYRINYYDFIVFIIYSIKKLYNYSQTYIIYLN